MLTFNLLLILFDLISLGGCSKKREVRRLRIHYNTGSDAQGKLCHYWVLLNII